MRWLPALAGTSGRWIQFGNSMQGLQPRITPRCGEGNRAAALEGSRPGWRLLRETQKRRDREGDVEGRRLVLDRLGLLF